MRLLKNFITNTLLKFGVEARRRQPFGMDLLRDVHTAIGTRPANVIFDVGANVGQTAIEYVTHFPKARIHSFEPNPKAYAELVKAVADLPRITPHLIALGRKTEQQMLHLTSSSLTGSLLPVAQQASQFLGSLVEDAGEVSVHVQTTDEFVLQHKIKHIDVLKLDVQGFELELLHGAERVLSENRISVIATELNFVPLYGGQAYFEDIYRFLLARGFHLLGLYHADYRAGPYIAWCDGVFVNAQALAQKRSQ